MIIYFIDTFLLLSSLVAFIIHFFVRNKKTYKIAGYWICGIIITGCLLYILCNQHKMHNCYFSETIHNFMDMCGIFNM